jgi:hypothetical protein
MYQAVVIESQFTKTNFNLGTVFIKAKSHVENCSDKGRYQKTFATYHRHEDPMVLNIFNAA